MPIQGTKLVLADADKDGKADLFHNNRRGGSTSIRPGAYVWEFKVATMATGVESNQDQVCSVPVSFELQQNYPNPFNPTTTIGFVLTKASQVKLNVYDISGRLVARLLDEQRPVGAHQVIWNGKDMNDDPVATGVYFYSISDQTSTKVRKMMLIK
jgi:flagellar hook assembly protein FlgD